MSGSNMGGVDAGIALQAGRGVQQANPLQQVEQFVHASQGINQLKLFPGAQQLQQQEIERGGVNNARLINQSVAQGMSSLLAQDNIPHSDLTGVLASLETRGLPTHGVASALASLPQGDGPEFTAAVKKHILANMFTTPESAYTALTPETRLINNGQVTAPVNIAPRGLPGAGNLTPAAGSVAQVLSPEFLAQQVGRPVTGEEAARLNVPPGTPITETMAQRLFSQGAGTLTGPAGAAMQPGGNLPAALRNTPVGGNGRFPSAAGAPPASVPFQPTPGVVTGQSPSVAAAQTQTGGTAAKSFQDITDQGVQARSQGAILANVLSDANQITPGPGTDLFKRFKQIVQAAGIPGVDSDKLAATESLDKLLAQITNPGGAGSDARLAVTMAGSPNSHLSPSGLDNIVRQLQGNADYAQARLKLANAYPDKSNISGFETEIGDNLNPRVFQYARLKPEQKAVYFKAMDPKDRRQLIANYEWAEKQHLVGAQ